MKSILCISGSPRKGNSEWILKNIFEQLRQLNFDCEFIRVRDNHINYCDGCLKCEEAGLCVKMDDMQSIYSKILDADLLLFSTPVYFDSIPGSLKNFLDRLNPLLFNDRLKDKYVGFIIVGQLTGNEGKLSKSYVKKNLKNFSEICKMNFVNSFYSEGRNVGEVETSKNKEACLDFANRIAGIFYE